MLSAVTRLAIRAVLAAFLLLLSVAYAVPNSAANTRPAGLNAKQFGAVGDGLANDTMALNDALRAAGASVNGVYGAFVYLPKGTYLVDSTLIVPNGVGLRGDGPTSTVIKASPAFNAPALIRNASQDGTQEFAFLESLGLEGNRGGGALISEALISFGSLFINSYIRDVVVLDSPSVGLHLFANNGMGPFLIENVWVAHSASHNVLIEEMPGNLNAAAGIQAVGLWSEHQGNNSSALYLKGLGRSGQWNFSGIHIEQGGTETGRTGITIDGVSDVALSGVQLQAGTAANELAGIRITNAIQNARIQIRSVSNINLINPVLVDSLNGVTINVAGDRSSIPIYVTPDVSFQGSPRFLPPSGGKSAVFQNNSAVDRAWFDSNGRLTGASADVSGVSIMGDATSDRPFTVISHASGGNVYGLAYPPASGGALRWSYMTGGKDIMQWSTDGSVFVYEGMTLQSPLTLQSSLRGSGSEGAAPSSGTHVQGEVVFNANPRAGGKLGWVCVIGGSPGTWKAFGTIDP
jgi:hypothetical protein